MSLIEQKVQKSPKKQFFFNYYTYEKIAEVLVTDNVAIW